MARSRKQSRVPATAKRAKKCYTTSICTTLVSDTFQGEWRNVGD